MATCQLDIPLRRSLDPNKRVACLHCLQRRLRPTRGVVDVAIAPNGDGAVLLKLEYDPRIITLSELQAEVGRAGACFTSERVTRILSVAGMVSPLTEDAIEDELGKLPGVASSASYVAQSVRVEFDPRKCDLPGIIQKLSDMGLEVGQDAATLETASTASARRERRVRRFDLRQWVRDYPKFFLAAVGGLFLLGAFFVHQFDGPMALRLGLVIPAYLLCGWFTGRDTFHTLWQLRFDVDVLMFAAALGAAALGSFEEGGLLLFLFAVGTGGEEMAMDKARRAIHALAKLAPETAIVRMPDGHEQTVRVEALHVGDTVVVRPFDRVAADGVVVQGASAVDQAPITGESIPAEKTVGDQVFAGTINGEGLLVVEVTKRADQSTLARVIRMVDEAQTAKSPTQVFTDRVERFYVPIVLISTALLVFVPPLVQHGGWVKWFYRAMAFLTAASPCALAIGTPAAVLSGIARAARAGVLIKGGVHLENLGRVDVVAFDKTGTLTRGKPELLDIVLLGQAVAGTSTDRTAARHAEQSEASGDQTSAVLTGDDPANIKSRELEILALADAVERNSSHPLAKAISAEAAARGCAKYAAENVEQIPGQGVIARVNGKKVAAGRITMLETTAPGYDMATGVLATLSAKGRTSVVVAVDGVPAAVLGLADRPRDNAPQSLRDLHQLGIRKAVMLTGDHQTVAAAMAAEVGIDEFHGDLLPEAKVEIVRRLSESGDGKGGVAMVGDGVNDAPAMAAATVGIAMGGAGTDVALETADVALMADDLSKLSEAIGLSRMSRRIITQNLAIALGVILVVAPIAAMGGATLSVAVLLHEGSTVVVVCNALRLLFYKKVLSAES